MEHSTQKIQVIGKKFKVNFGGNLVFQLDFQSDTQMTFTPILANGFGTPEAVKITMVEIRPNVYMVYWKEKSNTTVVHVEDFENGVVHTNITVDKDTFLNLSGTLTEIK